MPEVRLEGLPWSAIEDALWRDGYAVVEDVLTAEESKGLAALYERDEIFRSRVVMEAHGFGRGQYRYFAYPLPPLVGALREGLYEKLAPIANRWSEALRLPDRFPGDQQTLFDRCAQNGQTRPTPLLLKYEPGDWNALHQDLYGQVAFPFQVTLFLSEPATDFTGGEFVLVEQRPRAQSRPEVIVPSRGAMLVFANRYRPVQGKNGTYRTTVRHGVSRVRSGRRFALGIIFHDAR